MPNAQLEPIAPFTSLPSPAARSRHAATENRLVLWRLRRAPDDFVCTTVLTSYGYAHPIIAAIRAVCVGGTDVVSGDKLRRKLVADWAVWRDVLFSRVPGAVR